MTPGLDDDGSATGSEPAESTGTTTKSSSPVSFDERGLRGSIRKGIDAVTGLAHVYLTRDELDREAGLWLAEDEEADDVAASTASIVHRHSGIGAAANPDVVDMITGLVALAHYVMRQLLDRLQLREARRAGATSGTGEVPPDEVP